ncbi:MAG: hypothetical protein Q8O34_05625 [Rhodocyclaceae bacterium]|nr:hypothetical protein [Rhodocyclaceae bacterium]
MSGPRGGGQSTGFIDCYRRGAFVLEAKKLKVTYVPFPDPRSHRIRLADLRDEAIRNRLRTVWLTPLALDPKGSFTELLATLETLGLARRLEDGRWMG